MKLELPRHQRCRDGIRPSFKRARENRSTFPRQRQGIRRYGPNVNGAGDNCNRSLHIGVSHSGATHSRPRTSANMAGGRVVLTKTRQTANRRHARNVLESTRILSDYGKTSDLCAKPKEKILTEQTWFDYIARSPNKAQEHCLANGGIFDTLHVGHTAYLAGADSRRANIPSRAVKYDSRDRLIKGPAVPILTNKHAPLLVAVSASGLVRNFLRTQRRETSIEETPDRRPRQKARLHQRPPFHPSEAVAAR